MNLITNYMTRNDCYTANRKITPKGIMVHSTAAPGVMASSWFERWNKSYKAGEINRQACVHAFVDDKQVCQYLPWDHRGWHAGGSANDTHIGFEICEPAGFHYEGGSNMVGYDATAQEPYFRAAWQNAVDLCVMLCHQYGLNETNIICHSEGHAQGIASNHSDVMHWFVKHGENMDTFRAAVKVALDTNQPVMEQNPYAPPIANVRKGDKGEAVKWVQWNLKRLGYDLGPYGPNKDGIDGEFGGKTDRAVRSLQKSKGLLIDGIVGKQTRPVLQAV